jgi:hypothetical protein
LKRSTSKFFLLSFAASHTLFAREDCAERIIQNIGNQLSARSAVIFIGV